jgi:hypothetical protein
VDDGWGWKDEDGDVWTFIAYYNHWAVWLAGGGQEYHGFIQRALTDLRDAYIYTGDIRYAHKGMILLDRIADLYPEMDITAHHWYDGFDNGDPAAHSAQGKIVHDIWETGLVKTFILAYDAFFPAIDRDPELVAFLSEKARIHKLANPKNSPAAIKKNIEDNILRLVYPGVKNSQIRGNMGMHQSALALAAVVQDEEGTSKEWLEFVFQAGEIVKVTDPKLPFGRKFMVTGGNLDPLFYNDVDRDGFGDEASPGYNIGWLKNILIVAEAVDGYERYPEYDLFKNPKFLKMFCAYYPLIMLDRYVPPIGDSGKTGNPGLLGELNTEMVGFEKTGDPYLAQLIYMRNGNRADNLHGSIFSRDPEKLARDIEAIVAEKGPFHLDGTHLTGYGFSALRDGEGDDQRGIWLYYGRNTGHGHLDTLNLGVHAFGVDLAPDLGYPEVTGNDPERLNWTNTTVSHNTVVVDKAAQKSQIVSIPRHIDNTGRVRLIDVEAPHVYPQTDMYRRTTAMIRVNSKFSYAVDFFRIKGGNDHVFSFHGAEGTVTTEGLNLVPQPQSTYAGPDVPYKDPAYNKNGLQNGFNYLINVERDDDPAETFSVDWSVKDTWNVHPHRRDIHLRLTMLGNFDDVALADGVPPQNKPGNPGKLKYLLVHRSGSDLNSIFTSVIEPYENERFTRDIRTVAVTSDGEPVDETEAKAAKVTLADGRVDYVISALDREKTYIVDGLIEFAGSFGVYSLKDGETVFTYLHDGLKIGEAKAGKEEGKTKPPSLHGTVESFTTELSRNNKLIVRMHDFCEANPEDLAGKYIHIDTDGARNGSYEIKSVKKLQGSHRYEIDVGTVTFIRSMADAWDKSKGFVYDIAPGAEFTIPLTYTTGR